MLSLMSSSVFRRAAVSLLLAVTAVSVHALPPRIEADRQLKAAASEMQQDKIDWKRVLEALNAAEATGAKLPENFDYYMGMALSETGDPAKAMQVLKRYLERYGQKAKSYNQALEQLNIAERRHAKKLEADELARKAALEREAIERAWELQYFEYWVMDVAGSGTCARAFDLVRAAPTAKRNLKCGCNTRPVDHPNWRGHFDDMCRGRFEVNRTLDPKANLSRQGTPGYWNHEIRNQPFP